MSDEKMRLLTIVTLVIVTACLGIFSFIFSGRELALIVLIFSITTFIIFKPLLYRRAGIVRLRIIGVTAFLAITFLIIQQSWLFEIVNSVIVSIGLTPFAKPFNELSNILIILISGITLIFLTRIKERQNITDHPKKDKLKGSSPFKEPDYIELRNRFCRYMVSKLDNLDIELNWSDNNYTTLEAEVEVIKSKTSKSRIEKDLIKAIKSNNSQRSFLVIGDPGSGKSVSLRHLTRILYQDVLKRGNQAMVPLYINLKKWDGAEEVTDKEISEFAKRYIIKQAGRDGKKFIKKYFERIRESGGFFFLFDSFDELPMVLDTDDRSNEIKKISKAFDVFLGDLHYCRGVLSSRPFRQPTAFNGLKIKIRPFKEKQIIKAMKNWLLGENIDHLKVIRNIFKERPHLAPALRNPFMSELVAIYVVDNGDKLPDTFFDLFNHYLDKRLNEDIDFINELSLTKEEVLNAAIFISKSIFENKNVGLEISMDLLEHLNEISELDKKLKVLNYSRLIRWGGSNKDRFSFVHRRFAEFFAVQALLLDSNLINKNAIPSDSRWRDTLVVYCGVAPLKEVKSLAQYAWDTIQKYETILFSEDLLKARPAIHCLRFLKDACQSRPSAISEFQDDLSILVVKLIDSKDKLTSKIACGILPILTPDKRSEGIAIAFNKGGTWVSETALISCRHLASIETQAIKSIKNYIKRINVYKLLTSFSDLNFTLGVSDSLKEVKLILRLNVISIILRWFSFLLFLLYFIKLAFWRSSILLVLLILLLEMGVLLFSYLKRVNKSFLSYFRIGFVSSLRFFCLVIFVVYTIAYIKSHVQKGFYESVFSYLWVIMIGLLTFSFDEYYSIFKMKRNHIYNAVLRRLKSLFSKDMLIVYGFLALFSTFLILLFIINKYILSVVIAVITITYLAYLSSQILKFILKVYNDFKILKTLEIKKQNYWYNVCRTSNAFKTDWGQSKYLRKMRLIDINITNFNMDEKIVCRGDKSETELAILKEHIFQLRE
ncbi:hypothetical protein BFR04_02395 [Gaetbulibacter sp. 4G1]|nr:NACHT domain-containing protein [Gaetbulibacter sp. 4G1]PIA78407.1 hypothetical protein BFR04_02395 [Gaetbulibacter sp. 4G1]